MSRYHLCLILCLVLVWPAVQSACAAEGVTGYEAPDPFIGDWKGTLKGADGAAREICAQVICWGKGEYQANLLDAFDTRVEPIAVLRGKVEDGKVAFGETASVAGGEFAGTLTGERAGTFSMKHVVRLSPTLGAEPPAGAIVLFDGTNVDEWTRGGRPTWIVYLGGQHCVAYLRSRITCPKAQPALLEMGSDDGVKAWLNGKLVHANNAEEPVRAWEGKAPVELVEGTNTLLLKINQSEGGWWACARIRTRDGKDIEGLRFDPIPRETDPAKVRQLQGESSGTIVTWELAGPYLQEGKLGAELFDIAFAPEKPGGEEVEWRIANDDPPGARDWKLVEEGAMEIAPGGGSMRTNRQWADHKLHIEFRTPFEPTRRGQGRGNSGVYLHGREIQVLDSYGLEGKKNECGAIYGRAAPLVNMCAPPMQWQTFDVELRTARVDEDGKKIRDAHMTVHHNGVLVHDKVSVSTRGSGRGGLSLQDHGNRLRYRNIWVLELEPE